MNISLAEASLLALFLESLLYGVFLTLYLISLSILLAKTGIQRQILIPVATLLLCVATAHLVVAFVRALEAFVFKVQTFSADTYANRASPLSLANTALYGTQTALADAVMVWRCYVINHRSLWFAIPGCIAVLANVITGCYIVWTFARTPGGFALPITADNCIIAFYALTMIISVTCTSLIAWRIHRAPSVMSGGSLQLLPAFIVIIETSALYAASVLALLIAFLTGSNSQYMVLDIIVPIVGIAFCLIILQVHFQIGGNYIISNLFRDVGDIGSIGPATVLTTVRITEETETETETGMIQSDMIGRNKSQSLSMSVFRL